MDIEQLLLAKLAKEKEQTSAAPVIGGVTGALAGGLAGQGAHSIGNKINDLKDQIAARQGLTRQGLRRGRMQNLKSRVTPGNRMAGGLVGLILGGALGAGTRAMMIDGSPTAAMLAKLQTSPDGLNEQEIMQLEALLSDSYKDIIKG